VDIDTDGRILGVEVVSSRVRVTRMSYEEAEGRLDEPVLKRLHELSSLLGARRKERGAVTIELPEVKVKVNGGQVEFIPLPLLRSRTLVQEAMLLAGEAAARHALDHDIAFPFSTQEYSSTAVEGAGLSAMFAARRGLKRSQLRSVPGSHAGMGLEVYAQVTSPLRRYLDLVAHQQLRAHLRGEALQDPEDVLQRVGEAESVTVDVRRCERLSRKHWTLVYLLAHPDWRGDGILVERRRARGTVLIPEMALEAAVLLGQEIPLDTVLPLRLHEVNLAELTAEFRLEGPC
jgi:exoribonuclease-2